MILGGSENQLPLIKCAEKQGYKIVLCDYSEDNVGKEYADIFHRVSTLDKEALLSVAARENIDGIVSNSEPAMPTVSYVGNKMGLPSNPYESIVTLSRKNLFRNFLKNNGFNCPQSYTANDYETAKSKVEGLNFPLMVKPVDSSGSRGVNRIESVVELKHAFATAISFSKEKRVIVEEYIERTHDYMIGGDIFVADGKVVFWGLMNCLRDDLVNVFVPVGKSFPVFISNDQFNAIKIIINLILKKLNIRFGPFNVELMFSKKDRLFVIEMNPRNGGNKIPEILKIITGVDLVKATIEAALGIKNLNLSCEGKGKFISTYIIHSAFNGVLKEISYNEIIRENIIDKTMYKQKGDRVERFNSADKLIGIIFLKFNSLDEMKYKLEHIGELIRIEIE